jgi:serine/threonine-protein kinase
MVAAKLFEPGSVRQRVERYELVGEIASGGMATVFLARLGGVGGFQRFFAMKRLHPHLQNEKEFVEMFLDEARLSAGIHHPNVVSILEVGASPVGYYLVMEYVEGDTLARILARAAGHGERIPTPIALRMVIDSLQGLHAAHELKDDKGKSVELVHRDVSPQNVLVGIDGISRITDFGVARATSRLSSTRVGQLKGKLAYMAPEQAQGEGIDRRADVFSAGVLLWETLAGKRLFKAETEAATLQRVLNEPIPDLARIAPHLSSELCEVVKKALERDVNARYATAAQFADAIEAASATRDGVAVSRDVAAYVKSTIGEEIEQQREAVRAWIARSEPTHAPPHLPLMTPSSVSVGAMSIPDGVSTITRDMAATRGKRRFAGILAGVGAVALLALGTVFWLTRRGQVPPAPVTVVVAAQPASAPAPVPPPVPATATPPAQESVETDPAPVTTPDSLPSASAATTAMVVPPPKPAPGGRQPRAQTTKKKPSGEDLNIRNPYR